ncbi:MAG TPA: hypothetical protein PK971_15240, partial [Saprospiraceae bacterium]|nr:hypothetical protein [Saprospiraceae bacterium]
DPKIHYPKFNELLVQNTSGFESEKQADFGQMSPLLEFVSLLMGGTEGGRSDEKSGEIWTKADLF